MALIACPKCGKEISDKAKKCPQCGYFISINTHREIVLEEMPNLTKDISIENERKKMLDEVELEIKRMKDDASEEIKLMNESAKIIADKRQKELESEYKKREQEFKQKREILEKSQNELEQIKEKQTSDLRCTANAEKKINSLNANILFMLISTVIMICFVVIVWRKIDMFSTVIENLMINNQIDSEVPVSNTGNVSNEEVENSDGQENIFNSDSKNEESVSEMTQDEETETVPDENVVSSDQDDISVENSSVSFEYTGNEVKFDRVYIYVKITNTGKKPIFLTSQKFHYINDVSVEKAYSELDTEILSGKSSLLEIRFDTSKLKAAGISTIDTFTYQYNTATDADSKNVIPGEITFTELGIMY